MLSVYRKNPHSLLFKLNFLNNKLQVVYVKNSNKTKIIGNFHGCTFNATFLEQSSLLLFIYRRSGLLRLATNFFAIFYQSSFKLLVNTIYTYLF